jgi:hypothetical protein
MGVPRGINAGVKAGQGGKNLRPYVKGGRTMQAMAYFAKVRAAGGEDKLKEERERRDKARDKARKAGKKLKDVNFKGMTDSRLDMYRERALFKGGRGGTSKKQVTETTGRGKNKKTKTVDLYKGRASSASANDRNVRVSESKTSRVRFETPTADILWRKASTKVGNKKITKTSNPTIRNDMQVGSKNTTRVSEELNRKFLRSEKKGGLGNTQLGLQAFGIRKAKNQVIGKLNKFKAKGASQNAKDAIKELGKKAFGKLKGAAKTSKAKKMYQATKSKRSK